MDFRRFFGRAFGAPILALAIWILLASLVKAQNLPPPGAYQPIPNFTGVGAGLQFRQAINDRLSGIQPIAPTIVNVAFASFPAEQDGTLIYCNNCTKTIPCAAGGNGAWAMGQNGQWTCGVGSLSPIADVNFNAHKVTNLASATSFGDALAFGQVGAQLGTWLQPFIRPGATTCQTGNTTSCTANKPSNTVQGDLLLFCSGMPTGTETVTPPASFTQIRQDQGNGQTHNCFYKVATASEPSTYTVGYSVATFGFGVLMDLGQAGLPDVSSGSTIASSTTFSQAAPVTTNSKDLMIVCASQQNPPLALTAPASNTGIANMGNEFCWSYNTAPATATGRAIGSGAWGVAQIAILPVASAPENVAVQDQPMTLTSLRSTNSANYSQLSSPLTGFDVNNCVNPVDPKYGADPTGANDSYAALDAASLDACAKGVPVCLPAGSYQVCAQPWFHTCASNPNLPDVLGAGRLETTILPCRRRSVMPTMVLAPPAVMSNAGGAGLAPALVGSGNSFNFGTGSVLFDADEALGNRALNGLAAFTAEGFFTTTNAGATQMLIGSLGAVAPVATGCSQFPSDGASPPSCKGAFEVFWDGADSKLKARFHTSTTGWVGASTFKTAAALSANTTYYYQLSYDGSNARFYHAIPGAALTSDGKIAMTGTVSQRVDEDLVLGSDVEYWHLLVPQENFQGKMDSVRLSNSARCTNDSGGCTAPNSKLANDANTVLLENWSNTSLPLVSPEGYFLAGGNLASTAQDQPWMMMRNFGLGNAGGNQPHIKDLTISGGSFNLIANVTAPQLENIGFNGAQYGLMLDQINDYGGSGRNLFGGPGAPGAAIAMSVNGGLTPLYNLNFTCGSACIETNGPLVSGSYFLTPSSTKWAIIDPGWLHVDSTSIDSENGGTFTVVEVPNMLQPTGPWLSVSNSSLASFNAPVITLDGQILGGIGIHNGEMTHVSGTGPYVDGTNLTGTPPIFGAVVFDNVTFEAHLTTPPSGNSFTSAGVPYQVIGGSTRTQTTLNGTTAGTAVWSQPAMDSSVKKVVVFLNGYENTTATAQTITYPIAFANVPKITADDSGGSTASTTALTLPASMSATKTGWVIVEGY